MSHYKRLTNGYPKRSLKGTAYCKDLHEMHPVSEPGLLDLQFDLPIQIRDVALNLVAQGPNSHSKYRSVEQ